MVSRLWSWNLVNLSSQSHNNPPTFCFCKLHRASRQSSAIHVLAFRRALPPARGTASQLNTCEKKASASDPPMQHQLPGQQENKMNDRKTQAVRERESRKSR
ncbi:hypothetical protein VTH06DRAFT_8618 [Thermothelomyces fergusii]